jgi:hypothetical protein
MFVLPFPSPALDLFILRKIGPFVVWGREKTDGQVSLGFSLLDVRDSIAGLLAYVESGELLLHGRFLRSRIPPAPPPKIPGFYHYCCLCGRVTSFLSLRIKTMDSGRENRQPQARHNSAAMAQESPRNDQFTRFSQNAVKPERQLSQIKLFS